MKTVVLTVLAASLGCLRQDPPVVHSAPPVHAETVTSLPVSPTPTVAAGTTVPPTAPTPGGTPTLLGAPITTGEEVRLATLVQSPARYAGHTVRTEGTVVAICQARGCWMEIHDETAQVHVRMHGHAFFIPRGAQGRRAEVQATVITANPQGECEREAAQQTGQRVAIVELDATGVALLP